MVYGVIHYYLAAAPSPLKVEVFKLQVQLCKYNNETLSKLKSESSSHPLLRATYVLQSLKSYDSFPL